MKKRIHPLWLALSVLLSLAILALCVTAARGGLLRLQTNGEPEEVVSYFLNALITGEYRSAYACLSDYSTLGLENEPASASGRTLYRALRQSYGFRLLGDCEVDRLRAVQRLELRYLDVKAVESAIAKRVENIAAELVAERPAEEIYDEEGGYLLSFTDEVYATALDRVLRDGEDYTASTELELPLQYIDGSWKLQTTPALFSALLGGI